MGHETPSALQKHRGSTGTDLRHCNACAKAQELSKLANSRDVHLSENEKRTIRAMLLVPRARDDLQCTGVFCGARGNQKRPDLVLRRKDTPPANCEVECVTASTNPCVAKRHTVQNLSQLSITRRRQCTRLVTRKLQKRVLVSTLQAQAQCTRRRAQDQ